MKEGGDARPGRACDGTRSPTLGSSRSSHVRVDEPETPMKPTGIRYGATPWVAIDAFHPAQPIPKTVLTTRNQAPPSPNSAHEPDA